MTASSGPFKVVIVGGGPTGLGAAHALLLANINFVVLESKPDLSQDTGASLVIAPNSLRLMHQFGLLDQLMRIGAPLQLAQSFTKDGKQFCQLDPFKQMKKSFGAVPTAFHRHELIKTMYEGLPSEAKQRYHFNKKVNNIQTDYDSVVVKCEDGSSYHGSMVLGADGVYSKTRRLMRRLAMKDQVNLEWDDEHPFTSSYRCMWCSFPRPSEPGETSDTQHKDRSIMYLTGVKRSWIFLYEKLPEKTIHANHYSEQDMEKFAAQFAEWPVSKSLKVKDVFAKRLTAGMSELHEGVLDHWSWNRIVLAGDACHKFTPNAGQGFNTALQDVALLCNLLHGGLKSHPHDTLNNDELKKIFSTYQTERLDRIGFEYSLSRGLTRIHAWANPMYYLMGRYVMSMKVFQDLLSILMPRQLKKGYVLDYVRSEEPFSGTVRWQCSMSDAKE